MKLTEAKLKQMIKEMMTTGRLIHNGKPALSENGRKIEEMLMSRDGKIIIQAEVLLDALSSTLEPLEADYLDALAKAAVASATLKRIARIESEQYAKKRRGERPEPSQVYDHETLHDEFFDAFHRIQSIVGQAESQKIHRNFQGIVA